uniref:Uncharacterized protein K02A2.6-like n=1 Tax=Saccoglossus kowalevskii TaxID=10224 RepID=A0ABM0MGU7_SACKO|nr:PREDICTED: uncharacterized protein K02A2.6-like [Saccoglossus kowalevskii]
MHDGNWYEKLKHTKVTKIGATLRSLHATRDKLTITASKDLVLHGNRSIIPQILRQKIINIAHEGYQGIVKTKQLIREKVWFPQIDAMVEQTINSCIACQATPFDKSSEPLKMSKLPDGPWLKVSVDFADLATGEYLLVITDDYSRFPEVEVISSTSARTVIPRLDCIFSLLGTPLIVGTDNGPPFNGAEFESFANYLGFKHRKITPRWPKANYEVERFMKTIKKVYRTSHTNGKPFKHCRNYTDS